MEITVREAAKQLRVTPARVRQFVMEGRIKPRYLNPRMMVIDVKELAKVKNRKPGRPWPKKKGR